MKLIPHWRVVLRRAYSIRFAIAQAVIVNAFAGAVLAWPALQGVIPNQWFIIGAMLVSIGGGLTAILFRLLDQKIPKGDE